MPRRVAVLSVHTSPLAQPGTGDAGGLNVYVLQTALHMARRGVEVEIFTRATSSADPAVVPVAPGVLVRNVIAGPFEGLDKYDLPTQLCAFTAGVLRAEANHDPGHYDIVHSHYWLSGQVGWLARDRWAVPLVHTAHTLAAVKNSLKGKLVAWDPIAGKEAWHVDHKGPWNGGTLATAGGLVFQGTIDGHFNAYDAANGKELWTQDIYTAALAGPMTYEVDGEQYVAVGAGFGTLFYIIGGFALDQHLGVPENGRILVYKIGGKAVLPKPNLTKIPVPQPPAQTASAAVVTAGQMKYQTYCVY